MYQPSWFGSAPENNMAVVLFRTSTLQPTLRHQHISQQATLHCDTSVGNKKLQNPVPHPIALRDGVTLASQDHWLMTVTRGTARKGSQRLETIIEPIVERLSNWVDCRMQTDSSGACKRHIVLRYLKVGFDMRS